MAESGNEADAPGSDEEGTPPLVVHGQYIKDFSFEVPGAPQIFQELEDSPQIHIDVDTKAQELHQDIYEVVLTITANATGEGKTAFILELSYAGVFGVNLPRENHNPVVMIEAPRLLFPFARSLIADVTRDGGFPPLMLSPIDFAALYQERQQEQGTPQQEARET